MSTTIRSSRLATRGEPLSRGRPAAGQTWWAGGAQFLRWAAARPGATCLVLSLIYVATLAGLVAVLMAAALNTPIGIAVLVLFAAEVLVFAALAVYAVIPERKPG